MPPASAPARGLGQRVQCQTGANARDSGGRRAWTGILGSWRVGGGGNGRNFNMRWFFGAVFGDVSAFWFLLSMVYTNDDHDR